MGARGWVFAVVLGASLSPASRAGAQAKDEETRVIDGRVCRPDTSRPTLRSGPRWVCEEAAPERRERVRRRSPRPEGER